MSKLGFSLVSVLSLACGQPSSWEALYKSGMLARDNGRFDEARIQLEAALADSGLDAQNIRRAEIYTALANVYEARGNAERAKILYTSARSIIEIRADDAPALMVTILSDLGVLLLDQGQTEEAHQLLDRSLKFSRTVLGDQSPTTAMASASLARFYKYEGKLDVAEELLVRAERVYSSVRPPRNTGRIMALQELGMLYVAQGRYSLAEPMLQMANEAAREFGETHYLFAQSLVNLADVYRLKGEAARAAPLLKKALAINERSLGPDNAAVADVLLDMSNDAIAEKRYSFAEDQIKRALAMLLKVDGTEHAMVAFGESRLAEVYIFQRKYTGAEELLNHACAVAQRLYPAGNPLVAKCLYLMAELDRAQRQYAEAEQKYKMAISTYEKTIGVCPGLALAVQHYAELLKINRTSEARALLARAKELQVTLRSFK